MAHLVSTGQNHCAEVLAAFPQGSTSEPAQLVADLKKVAERFETNTNGRDKDSATPHPDTVAMKVDQAKTDQKAVATPVTSHTAEGKRRAAQGERWAERQESSGPQGLTES